MTWNYRIIKVDNFYSIHEVYYNEDGSVDYWAEDSAGAFSESEKGVKRVLKMMKKATKKPVLQVGEGTTRATDTHKENEMTKAENKRYAAKANAAFKEVDTAYRAAEAAYDAARAAEVDAKATHKAARAAYRVAGVDWDRACDAALRAADTTGE